MAGVIATIPKFQFSANGVPLVAGTLTVYLAGTTTPTDTWQDQALTTLNTNPIVLDARGECVLWLDSTKSYKFILKNSTGVTQWTQDNISGAGALASTLRTDLAASSGSSLVGNNGETVADSLNALQLADYTALRAYTGPRKSVYITGYLVTSAPSGVAGMFVRDDSDTTSVDNGGTIIVAGAVRWKRNIQSPINIQWFGAIGDGSADDTAAIQAAVSVVVAHTGGKIYVPNPSVFYKCTATISIASTPNSIKFIGDGIWNSEIRLASAAATTLFNNTNGNLSFSDMSISGMPSSGNVFRVGDKGIVSSGVVNLTNVSLYGFQNLMQWTGSYYHKFSGCDFRYADVCFIGFNANNLTFDKCRAQEFNTFLEVSGGSGPVSFINGSLEQWTTRLFSSTGGATVQNLNLHNTYIENYPATAVAAGLTGAFYNNGFGIVGYETISLKGNMISLKGVRRIISQGATSHITSIGNRYIYEPGATSTCDFIYVFTNLKSGTFNDFAGAELPAGAGANTTAYIAGSYDNVQSVSIYDPITKTDISPQKIMGADVGDASVTLNAATSRTRQIWNTPLTAIRVASLSTLNVSSGATFEIARTAAATGAFNLEVGSGPLKVLTAGQWCEVIYNGSAWVLTKFGSL